MDTKILVSVSVSGVRSSEFYATWEEAVDRVIDFGKTVPPRTPAQAWIEGEDTCPMVGVVIPRVHSREPRDCVYTGGIGIPYEPAKARVEAALGPSVPNGPHSDTCIINLWKDR